MNYRTVLRWIFYSAVFFLFSYAESELLISGAALALLMALFYARENLIVVLPMFAASQVAFRFSLVGAIYAAVPVAIVLAAALLQYKFKQKGRPALVNLYTLLACVPFAVFAEATVQSVVFAVLSVVASIVLLNVFLSVLYATRVRKLKYKLSPEEVAAAFATLFVFALSFAESDILGFPIFPIFGVFVVSFAASISPFTAIVAGGVAGLGAAFSEGSFAVAGLWLATSLGAAFLKNFRVGVPILLVLLDTLFNFVFGVYQNYSYFYVISGALGGILYLSTFRLFDKPLEAFLEIERGGIAERSVINRTRLDTAEKLRSIGDSFSEIEDSLKAEYRGDFGMTVTEVTDAVLKKRCEGCPEEQKCKDALGDGTGYVVAPLALAALEKGKASLLDMPSFLSSRCVNANGLLNEVNEIVGSGYRKIEERKAEREVGTLVARLIAGVRGVLESLREEIGSPVSYLTKTERELIDQLNFQGVAATEAIVFGGKKKEVSLLVKEDDSKKEGFRETVSKVMGAEMIETKKEPAVCGTVSVTFREKPRYALTYGKSSLSKEEGEPCGDTVEAIRLTPSKVMLVLSDGMGSGQEAHETSRLIVNMLAGFYKAEFTHDAVISAASGLFSLRRGENFNALDVAVLDLVTGDTDFIKMGGRETYLVRGNDLEILPAGTLPLGILDDQRPAFFRRNMREGDFFLMMSDGVADALKTEEIETIIQSFSSVNPETMAKEVVSNALRLGGRIDDMSCVAARFFRT